MFRFSLIWFILKLQTQSSWGKKQKANWIQNFGWLRHSWWVSLAYIYLNCLVVPSLHERWTQRENSNFEDNAGKCVNIHHCSLGLLIGVSNHWSLSPYVPSKSFSICSWTKARRDFIRQKFCTKIISSLSLVPKTRNLAQEMQESSSI